MEIVYDIVFSVVGLCKAFHMWEWTPLLDNKSYELCKFYEGASYYFTCTHHRLTRFHQNFMLS